MYWKYEAANQIMTNKLYFCGNLYREGMHLAENWPLILSKSSSQVKDNSVKCALSDFSDRHSKYSETVMLITLPIDLLPYKEVD